MSFRTNALKVQAFAGAVYGIQVGTTTMAQINADITSAGGLANALNAYYASSFGSVANATVANTIATNLGLTGAALTSGAAYITAQLNAAAPAARGAVISNILDLFAGLASDATFGAAATAWNAKVDAANAYTGAANVAIGSTVNTGTVFTLTTSVDVTSNTSGNDTYVGTFGNNNAASTFNAGDVVDGGAGTGDVLSLTAIAAGAHAPVTVKNVETINIVDTVGSTLNGVLIENAPAINFKNTIDAQTSTVTSAAIGSTYGLQGQGDLTVTYASVTGTADTAKLSLMGAGTATTNSVAVNVSTTNAIEAVEIATTGTNVATLTAGTGAASIKVTGDGTNTLTIGSSASAVTIDASGSTGTNSINIGTELSGTDTIKGGSGADTLVANLTSATQVNPTVTGVETITLDFDGAGIFNAGNVTGATKLNIAGSAAAATVTNLAGTTNTLGTTTSNAGAVSVSYASGAAAAVTYNTGNTGTTATAVSNASTTFANIASLTVAAAGNSTTGLGATALGSAATALTLNTAAAANDLTLGAVTGTALKTIDINATAGDVTVGTVNNADDGSTLTGLKVVSTGGADITIGNIDANSATASAFSSISISGEANTTLTVGTITGLTAKNTVSTYNVTLGDTIGASSIGAVTAEAIGNVNVTVGANSTGATLTVGALTADSIGNITVKVGTNNTVAMSSDDSGGASYTIGNIVASGAGIFTFSAGNGAAADTIGTVDLSGLEGGSTVSLLNIDVGTSMTGGKGVDNLSGTAGADIINGGAGADVLLGSDGADQITGGEGADAIASGKGADIVTLTETTAAIDTVVFGNETTATGGTDIAFGALGGADTITGFTAGAGGDSLTFDISGFGLAGGTEYVGAIGALTVDSSDEIVILTGAGYATDEAAENAVAGRVTTDGLDMIIVYFNTGDNTAHIIHDTDAGVDGTGTTTLVGVISNLTTQTAFDALTAANIASFA